MSSRLTIKVTSFHIATRHESLLSQQPDVKWTCGVIYESQMYDTKLLFQGVTFRVEQGEMVIARILHGSSIDRQGMLHTGDIIREVNGCEVSQSPQELQELLGNCTGSVTLKVLPSYRDSPAPPQVGDGGREKEAAIYTVQSTVIPLLLLKMMLQEI